MRISDWSSDVCSSDLAVAGSGQHDRISELSPQRLAHSGGSGEAAFLPALQPPLQHREHGAGHALADLAVRAEAGDVADGVADGVLVVLAEHAAEAEQQSSIFCASAAGAIEAPSRTKT